MALYCRARISRMPRAAGVIRLGRGMTATATDRVNPQQNAAIDNDLSLFQSPANCFKMLRNASTFFVTKCFELLRNVSFCYLHTCASVDDAHMARTFLTLQHLVDAVICPAF
jgi:hypothetical protein